jgi:hypothetical protein
MQELLDEVIEIVGKHREDANKTGENFNIFNILGMRRGEVNPHCRFLYELLNPEGVHGIKDVFLRLFIEDTLAVSGFKFENIRVKRELKTTNISRNNRRIDLFISSSSHVIGIEVKIDAEDQDKQLNDYWQELVARSGVHDIKKEPLLYYLTLGGHGPSLKSKRELENDKYNIISFKEHILTWLEKCMNDSGNRGKVTLKEAINQYKILIESLTGSKVKMLEEIAGSYCNDPHKLKIALEIGKSIKSAKKMIQCKFWEKLKRRLESTFKVDVKFCPKSKVEDIVNYYYDKNKEIYLTFTTERLKDNNLQFCVRLVGAIHYGLNTIERQIDARRSSKGKEIEKSGELARSYWRDDKYNESEPWWEICFYNDNRMNTINFRDFNEEAISFADNDKLETAVGQIVGHAKKIIGAY